MPAGCSSSRAARRRKSSTCRAPAGASSPTSAVPATATSATASIDAPGRQALNTTPPTDCAAWQELAQHAESAPGLRKLFAGDAARGTHCIATAPGVRLDYSRQRLDARVLRLLGHLAEQRGVAEWGGALLGGRKINSPEDRA